MGQDHSGFEARGSKLGEEINRLQGSLRGKSSQIYDLMSELDYAEQKLVFSDNRIHPLETQLREAKLMTANGRKEIEDLEQDARRLRKELESEKEVRKKLENHVPLIDTLRSENRAAAERRESELKSVKESVAKYYLDQLKELHQSADLKQKELEDANRITAEQKHTMENLNERLSASMQSCAEANAIISSQEVKIAELKEQLDEERTHRKEEQEKAATDLKTTINRAQSEAQEEIRRLSNDALRRERELQEAINKLQEVEREMCLQVETLRSKLEDIRKKLGISDNKVCQLETQIHEEKLIIANGIKKIEELEQEATRLRKKHESEQTTREEVWAKVSILELEKNATMQDLDFDRWRLRDATERLMFHKTQLWELDSTTEEIQILFTKQLKAMQKALEDEENYENTSVDMDGVIGGTSGKEKEVHGVGTAIMTEGNARDT